MKEAAAHQVRNGHEKGSGDEMKQTGLTEQIAALAMDNDDTLQPSSATASFEGVVASSAAAVAESHETPCKHKDAKQIDGAINALSKDDGVDFGVQPLPNERNAEATRPAIPGAYAEGGPAFLSIRNRPGVLNSSGGIEDVRSSRTGSISTMGLSLINETLNTEDISSGLAVAKPVSQEQRELPLAKEMDLEGGGQADGKKQSLRGQVRSRVVTYCLLGAIALVLCGIAILVVFLVDNNETENPQLAPYDMTNNETSHSPTTSLSVFDHIAGLLPDFTLKALDDPTSSQSSAMEWLLNDPALDIEVSLPGSNTSIFPYPDWRLLQRFALASFYFSTGGPDLWFENDYWLNYNVSECFWFAKSSAMGQSLNVSHAHPTAGCDVLKGDNVFRHVWLFSNGLEGKLPEEFFFGLPQLENLFLFLNNLETSLPSRIGQLSSLRNINLARTYLEGSLPTELGMVTTMVSLQLFGTQVYGTVPSELGHMTKLTKLDLSQNMLTGSLPTELGLLTSVEKLFAATNRFEGGIPSELGVLESLTQLDLHGNELTGAINGFEGASFITTSLESLDVSRNNLSGSLPSALALLVNLTTFVANDNELTGSIPMLQALPLVTLNLTGNSLSGSIQESLCMIENLSFDCNGNLCGCNCSCGSST